jgi:hypothetical protein
MDKAHIVAILMIASLMTIMVISPASALTQEETRNVSATIDQISLGQNITLRGSIRFPITLTSPQEVNPNETATLSLQIEPITLAIELDLPPSINRTIISNGITVTGDPDQVLLEPGITMRINFSTTEVFNVNGPADLEQSILKFDYIFERQNNKMTVSPEATNQQQLGIRVDTYVTPTISLSIQLENFTAIITDFPLPNLHFLPANAQNIDIGPKTPEPSITPSPTTSGRGSNFFNNPFIIVIIAIAIVFIIAATLALVEFLRQRRHKGNRS